VQLQLLYHPSSMEQLLNRLLVTSSLGAWLHLTDLHNKAQSYSHPTPRRSPMRQVRTPPFYPPSRNSNRYANISKAFFFQTNTHNNNKRSNRSQKVSIKKKKVEIGIKFAASSKWNDMYQICFPLRSALPRQWLSPQLINKLIPTVDDKKEKEKAMIDAIAWNKIW